MGTRHRRAVEAARRGALLLPVLLATAGVSGAQAQEGPAAFLTRARAEAASAPPPPGCVAVRPDAAGRVAEHPLPGKIVGAAAGTTGGLGHRLLMVTSADDGMARAGQPGTLRWAVETARESGGGWIAFAPALRGQVIRLSATLRLPSNTTLDGGCGGVTLSAAARTTSVLVADVSNVIVGGLAFTKEEYAEPHDRTGDAIGLTGKFDRVAILHNAFSRCGDGCVDVVRRRPSVEAGRVTVAFNRFANHNKVMLVGALTCSVDRGATGCDRPLEHLTGAMRPVIRVTLLANVFEGTSQRHPKVVTNAAVRSVNNLLVLAPTRYADGRDSASYGAAAAGGGVLAMQGDIVVNPTSRPRVGGGPVSALREAAGGEGREADGAVAVSGVASLGAVGFVQNAPEIARAEVSAEPPVPALDAQRDPLRLAACLLRIAGPGGTALNWPDACADVGRQSASPVAAGRR